MNVERDNLFREWLERSRRAPDHGLEEAFQAGWMAALLIAVALMARE